VSQEPDRPLSDTIDARPVLRSEVAFEGRVWDVRRDTVDLGPGGTVVRDYISHPGAVAVLALDEQDRVLVVHQYRHPVGEVLWEIPAGLCDKDGEPAEQTALRELWEETHHRAERVEPLLDVLLTPGSSSERLQVFLAHGVRPADGEPHAAHEEELGMPVAWVPLADLLEGVLAGRLRNPALVLGVLALEARRSRTA
jgi:ADP-ribose pyrophosphatase